MKEDIRKLYTDQYAFSTSFPIGLQNKVLFKIMLYMCRQGRENVRQMSKQFFTVYGDASVKKYIAQEKDELEKITEQILSQMTLSVKAECMRQEDLCAR